MSPRDGADAAFERMLLASAQQDGPSEAAEREAWARFTATAGGVALASAATLTPGKLRRALRHTAMRWFTLGALGGCLATVGWLTLRQPPAKSAAQVAAVSPTPPPPPSVPALSPHADESSPAPLPKPAPAIPPSRPTRSGAHAPEAQPRASSTGSSLALEIEALDVVQTALSAGAYERALGLVQGYERDFPSGQLGIEAEVLTIEALAGAGRKTEAETRARTFLAGHPSAPHVARVSAALSHLRAP